MNDDNVWPQVRYIGPAGPLVESVARLQVGVLYYRKHKALLPPEGTVLGRVWVDPDDRTVLHIEVHAIADPDVTYTAQLKNQPGVQVWGYTTH